MKTLLLIAFIFVVFVNSNAQDLVDKPKNPAFRGDTFNYQWLLSSAEAQNDFKEDPRAGFEQKTELERFKENLNNQLLNKISNSFL